MLFALTPIGVAPFCPPWPCCSACTPRIFSLLERNLRDMETHGVIAGVLIRPDDAVPGYLPLMDSDGANVDTLRFRSDHYALFAPVEHAYGLMAFQRSTIGLFCEQSQVQFSTPVHPFSSAEHNERHRDDCRQTVWRLLQTG